MWKRLLRLAVFGVLLLGLASALAWVWLRGTDATAADFKSFKRGDIIFQTSRSSQSAGILLASKSLYSHMGFVDFDDAGKAVVLESAATTRATPLEDWVKRGVGGRIAVYRVQELSDEQARAVSSAGKLHFGKPYDLFFFSSEDELYCSEFVRLAFERGAGLELGKYQQVGSLDLDNFAARAIIERRWQRYPMCRDGKAGDFESCFSIIKQQDLITPQSIADDRRLQRVYSNYGVLD